MRWREVARSSCPSLEKLDVFVGGFVDGWIG
jgi:hypothetical protein